MPVLLPAPYAVPPDGLFHQGKAVQKLEILYSEATSDLANGITIYRGKVVAKLGQTSLITDTLIVRTAAGGEVTETVDEGGKQYSIRREEAIATGKVEIIDPDGTIKAKNLWFTWNKDRRESDDVVGRADEIELHIAMLWVKAGKMEMSKKGLFFTSSMISSGSRETPLYAIEADDVTVVPGKKATAHGVNLSFFGVRLPKLPLMVLSLDPRANGVQLPRIGYRQGAGLGASWGGDYLIDDKTALIGSFNTYPDVLPSYRVAFAQSKVPVKDLGINQLTITDSFGDRSAFTFFGNIYNSSPKSVYERVRVKKDLYSLSTTFNGETFGRTTDRKFNYSKPFELAYEKGGEAGDWGYLVQARAGQISEVGGATENRLTLQGSLLTPVYENGRLTLSTRFDSALRLDRNSSGFVGGEGGFTYEPYNRLTFGAGAYGYHNFGTATFKGDNYLTNQGYVVRADWLGPANNISLLYRYDPQLGWFDKQFRLSQVIGSIEPVFVYRQAPRQYQLGIRFRVQDVMKRLQKREFTRSTDNDKMPEGNR